MLGSDVNDVVNAALMREGDLRNVERLRVDVAVDGYENSLPKVEEFTFDGVRRVSRRFCPVRASSL
jgi:hypothetical protein